MIKRMWTLLMLVAVLTACGGGGGGGGNTPTDTSLIFNLFPPSYFGGSYSASYLLTGSFSNGDNVTASWLIQSGSTTTFNAQSVNTIDNNASIKNTTTGAVSGSIGSQYYTTDTSNLQLIGAYRTIDGVTSTATSTNILPLTGSIGNFGTVGSYSLSDGTSTTQTWSLMDGYNGKAKLVTTNVTRDSLNALWATEVDSWTISQDGTRTAVSVTVTYHQSGNLTLTMSGAKS